MFCLVYVLFSGKPAASWDQNNPDWIPNQNLSTQEMHLTSLSADCDDNIRPSKRSQNTPSPAKRAQSRSKPSPGKRAKTKISLSQDDEYAENLPSPEPGSPSESEPLHLKCEQIENEDSFPSQSERFQCIPLLAEIAQQSHIVSFIDEHKVGEVKVEYPFNFLLFYISQQFMNFILTYLETKYKHDNGHIT